MFNILHIVGNSPITLLRLARFWQWTMIRPHEGKAYIFLRVVHAVRDVVEVEINYTGVVDTDPIIALRINYLVGTREYDLDLRREH